MENAMSTKDLSHSVIEGGRTGSNKWDRRNSHAETRAAEKLYLKEVTSDPEHWYDYDIAPTEHVYKEFDDKLGPVYRWLHSQVGRSWNDVRSEIAEKFDTRTTAGRHIVHDHLLRDVAVTPEIHRRYYYGPDDPTTSYYKNSFYVDDDGILQRKHYIPRPNRAGYKSPPPYNTNQIANWLSGRIVGKVGNKLFWFIPADKNKKRGGTSKTWRTVWSTRRYYADGPIFKYLAERELYKTDQFGKRVLDEERKLIVIGTEQYWKDAYPGSFRQGNKLSNKEVAYFNNLPEYYQKKVLEMSPTNPKPVRPDYRQYR